MGRDQSIGATTTPLITTPVDRRQKILTNPDASPIRCWFKIWHDVRGGHRTGVDIDCGTLTATWPGENRRGHRTGSGRCLPACGLPRCALHLTDARAANCAVAREGRTKTNQDLRCA